MSKEMIIAGTLVVTSFGGTGIFGVGATELPTSYNKNIAIENVNHIFLEGIETSIE